MLVGYISGRLGWCKVRLADCISGLCEWRLGWYEVRLD